MIVPVETSDPVASDIGVDIEALCDRVAQLAADGQLKPAVEEMKSLLDQNIDCPEDVLAAVKHSNEVLADADDHIRSALEKRRQGDLLGARAGLATALDLYPKYYWADKLQRDVTQRIEASAAREARQREDRPEPAISAPEPPLLAAEEEAREISEVERNSVMLAERRLSLARYEEQRGNLDEAESLIVLALGSGTSDPDLQTELIESARLVGLSLFSAGELTRARNLWTRALALDEGNDKLIEYLAEVEERLEGLQRIKEGERR